MAEDDVRTREVAERTTARLAAEATLLLTIFTPDDLPALTFATDLLLFPLNSMVREWSIGRCSDWPRRGKLDAFPLGHATASRGCGRLLVDGRVEVTWWRAWNLLPSTARPDSQTALPPR